MPDSQSGGAGRVGALADGESEAVGQGSAGANRQPILVVLRTPNGNDDGKDGLRQQLLAPPHGEGEVVAANRRRGCAGRIPRHERWWWWALPGPSGLSGRRRGRVDVVEIDAVVGHELGVAGGKLAAGEEVVEAPEGEGGVADSEGPPFDGDGAFLQDAEGAADRHDALGAGGVVFEDGGDAWGAAAVAARAGESRRREPGLDRGGECRVGVKEFGRAGEVGRGGAALGRCGGGQADGVAGAGGRGGAAVHGGGSGRLCGGPGRGTGAGGVAGVVAEIGVPAGDLGAGGAGADAARGDNGWAEEGEGGADDGGGRSSVPGARVLPVAGSRGRRR